MEKGSQPNHGLRPGSDPRKGAPADTRALALILLADCEMQNGDYAAAIALLQELVLLRRFAEDWLRLGICYLAQRQPDKALSALNQALAIRPYRHTIHVELAKAYQQLYDLPHAREHFEKAKWLLEHHQD